MWLLWYALWCSLMSGGGDGIIVRLGLDIGY